MAQIQVRRDTAADWTSANPTLASGEWGFEEDTGKVKIGNGTDAWADLDYHGESSGGDTFATALLHVRDEKTAGTAGGTFSSVGWQTRDLNSVETNEITGASLASNQVTLPAGDYYVQAGAPSFSVNRNKVRIRNVTDGATLVVGMTVYNNGDGMFATGAGRFTLAGERTVELQHRCNSGKSSNGFGVESNFDEVEVYADLRIWKVG